MNILAYILVQLAVSLMTLVEQNPRLAASGANAQDVAQAAIRTAVWAVNQNTPVNLDANIEKLRRAEYLAGNGVRVPLDTPIPGSGAKMRLLDEYTSFGDLDYDNLHDAMVMVRTDYPDGKKDYHLAAFRNYGGVMTNTANQKLDEPAIVYSHRIADKGLYLDYQPAGGARTTTFFLLHPNYTAPQPRMVIVRNPYFDGTIRSGATSKVASFLIFASPELTDKLHIEAIALDKDFNADVKLANIRLVTSKGYGGTEQAVVQDAEMEMPFLVNIDIPAGGVETVDVYADVIKNSPGVKKSVIDMVSGKASGGIPWPQPVEGQDVRAE